MGCTKLSLHQVPDAIREFLTKFPDRSEYAIPSITDAPVFSPNDVCRFGVIVVQCNSDSSNTFMVRTNFRGEDIQKIARNSFLYLTPILQVEDPEGAEAYVKGFYAVSCKGWKVNKGEDNAVEGQDSLSEVVQRLVLDRMQ
jgi:hypothetical protein